MSEEAHGKGVHLDRLIHVEAQSIHEAGLQEETALVDTSDVLHAAIGRSQPTSAWEVCLARPRSRGPRCCWNHVKVRSELTGIAETIRSATIVSADIWKLHEDLD